jgi:monoamine oxidase
METIDADFAVVGAGYAGLTAARRLVQDRHTVAVLEARDRVGGRVWTEEIAPDVWVDRGGAWFGPGQDRAYALAAELGVETYPTFAEGEGIYMSEGRPQRYEGLTPLGMGVFALANLGAAMAWIDEAAKRVPLDRPWEAPDAASLDSQTVGAWLRSAFNLPSGLARAALGQVATTLFSADPAEVSMLYLLFLAASHGGMERLTQIKGGNQQDRVVGGTQRILDRVHAGLGDAVHLGSPVRSVTQARDHVVLEGGDLQVRARRAILCVPPLLTNRIDFSPHLPNDRAMLAQRLPAGPMYKIALVYDDAWWRADGLTGQSLDFDSPVGLTLDACASTTPPGILNAFVEGPAAIELSRLGAAERRDHVVAPLMQRFGPRAGRVEQYIEQDWAAEPWSGGCTMGHCPPGVLTRYGPTLRRPAGRLHWATTETSDVTVGGIDGAIRAGERVAAEVTASEA